MWLFRRQRGKKDATELHFRTPALLVLHSHWTAKCKTYTTLFIWVLLVLRVPGKASSVLLSTLSPEGAIRLCLIKYQMMIPNNVCLRLEQNFNHILL